MSEPSVSVLLPTHNRPVWLAEALNSVLVGDFEDLEVVVSNNGQPEHTRELARVVRDPRVRWMEQDQSLDMLQNFTAALSAARGTYVAVLHDDDRWVPEFLTALVPPLESRGDAVLAFADNYVMDVDGRVNAGLTTSYSHRWGRSELRAGFHQPFLELAAHQTVPIIGSVFRRKALQTLSLTPDLGSFYDIWITYQLALTRGAAYFHNERLMYCRVHPTSATATNDLSGFLKTISCRRRMLEDPAMQLYRDVLSRALAQDHVSAGAVLLRRGDRLHAREHLEIAARLALSWKAVAGLAASWLAPRSLLARL